MYQGQILLGLVEWSFWRVLLDLNSWGFFGMILTPIFIMDTGLQLSFSVLLFSDLMLMKDFGKIPSLSLVLNSLRRTEISSWEVFDGFKEWLHPVLGLLDLTVFTSESAFFLAIGLLRFSVLSRPNLSRFYVSRNVSISSRFYSLLTGSPYSNFWWIFLCICGMHCCISFFISDFNDLCLLPPFFSC